MRFANKVAIVTGGASGIGENTVHQFVQEGAKVVIADFSPRGQELSDKLNQAGFDTLFVKTDVTSEAEVKQMVSATVEKYGKVDILFANAGIAKDGPVHNLSADDWQRTIDINLSGVFLCDKYVIEQMLAQGGGGVKLLTQSLGITYEVAKAVLFLASDDASFITGTSLLVDGGYTAQ